jgi:hypothetical protein
MRKGFIVLMLSLLVISVCIAGCINNQQSTSGSNPTSITGSKTSDLNIGETAILSTGDYSLAVKVKNFTYNEKASTAIVEVQYTNVGKKAIGGRYVVRYTITDWGGVEAFEQYLAGVVGGGLWSPLNNCFGCNYQLYPGDTLEEKLYFTISKRAMDGKLTFTFEFSPEDHIQQALWIIKPA